MIEYKLANIILENTDRFFNFKNLYVFTTAFPHFDESDEFCTFPPYASLDFATYFNSFSNKKWREYTSIDNVHFRMEMKGKAVIEFFDVKLLDIGLHKNLFATLEIDNDEFKAVDFEFPETDAELCCFRIMTLDYLSIKSGYYYSLVDESSIHDIHLAIATTTFKKEEYIETNVSLFKNDILACGDPVSDSVSMIIVDNGKTLDSQTISGNHVYVFSNKNVGGAGGFARGMIEAKRLKKPATHVLIMDDDVSISSESVKRTFNLLSLVNEDYKDAFVSGAMFSLGDQNIQLEDVGFANSKGDFVRVKAPRNMDLLYDIVKNEDDLPIRENMYAAFWYCCIPMKTIEREGLPLPIFIRYDDAEYGMRCKPKYMTMNGINVWHMDFVDRYSAFYERYCGVRNALIIQATSGICKNVDFFTKKFDENFRREIKKFNYGSAEMLLDAIDDFMAGPSFIAQERCEEILKDKMAKSEKFRDLRDLDINGISISDLNTSPKRLIRTRFIDRITYNGQRFIPELFRNNKPIAVRHDPNNYPGERFRFRKKVLVVDRLEKHAFFREANKKRFNELMQRYKKTVSNYKKHHEEVEQEYSMVGDYLKSEEFWKKYLEID